MPDPVEPNRDDSDPPESGEAAAERSNDPASSTNDRNLNNANVEHTVEPQPSASRTEPAPALPSHAPQDWVIEDPLGKNWAPVRRRRIGRRKPTALTYAAVWSWVRWIVAVPGVVYLALFFATSLPRIGFPFELEWFEGHQALQAQRVAQGLPIYPPPDTGWATFGYPPVYYWVVAILFRLFGFGLVWGRVVSLASTLFAAAGAGMIVYDRTRKALPSVVGGLLLFAYFKPGGFWYDLFRVDMLAQALLVWGAYFALRRRRTGWQLILGLILLGLAPLAKQTVAPVTAVVFLLVSLRYWRVSRYGLLLALVVLANAAAVLPSIPSATRERWTWIYRYLVENPQKHTFYYERTLPRGTTPDTLRKQIVRAPLETLGTLYGAMRARPPEAWGKFYSLLLAPVGLTLVWVVATLARGRRLRGGLWLLFGILLGIGSIAGWIMIGGFENNLIPAFAAAAIWFGLAYGGILRLAGRRPTRAAVDIAVLILLIVQFFPVGAVLKRDSAAERNPFWYRPAAQQPAPGSVERGRELVAWIASRTEPVYVPHHVYLSFLAGKELDYGLEAIRDLNYSGIPTPRALLDRMKSGHYRYILLDNELQWEWLPSDIVPIIKQLYVSAGSPLPNYSERELLPMTGAIMKPRLVFERKK